MIYIGLTADISQHFTSLELRLTTESFHKINKNEETGHSKYHSTLDYSNLHTLCNHFKTHVSYIYHHTALNLPIQQYISYTWCLRIQGL